MLDEYLSKFNEQAIKERANFVYHNGVVNQSIDMVFLLKHYDYVASLGIVPHPQVLKEFLLFSVFNKDQTLPDPFEYLSKNHEAEIQALDESKQEQAGQQHKETLEKLKKHYQHYALIHWIVNAKAYQEAIKPFLDIQELTLDHAKTALAAIQQALADYIAQHGDHYKAGLAQQTSWVTLDHYLRKIADEYHYHDVTYDLGGIKYRLNPKMERASQVLLAAAVLGMVLMLSFGVMLDYGVWSQMFYIGLAAAVSFPYLSISHMHRAIRDKSAQHHDEFQGMMPVEHQHKMAVISFFLAFTLLAFNMYALIAADAFAITMVTFTLLSLVVATSYEYVTKHSKNNQARTLANEKWIANRVDKISEDKITLDISDRYFNHTRAMFLSEGDVEATKSSLLYRRHMYEAAYHARTSSDAMAQDTFHDDLMRQDKFYQANAFVNEAIDFVAAAMTLTTVEANQQWVTTVVDASNKSGKPNQQTVHDFCSMSAYIAWLNQTLPLYLKDKDGKLQPLTEDQRQLLAKTDPNAEDCKALDLIRARYPQYHLLKACASLNLASTASDITAYRQELEKRIIATVGKALTTHTGTPFEGKTLESLHKALKQAQNTYGYWSLAAIPAQCRALDYHSTMTMAALGLVMATATAASLVYSDAVGLSFNVSWMGFALTCAAIAVIASVTWDGELSKILAVKQQHKDMEQVFKLAPTRVCPTL